MSVDPPPIPAGASSSDPVRAALRYRALFFALMAGTIVLILLWVMPVLSGGIEGPERPNELTLGLLFASVLSLWISVRTLYNAKKTVPRVLENLARKGRAPTLDKMGKALSAVAAGQAAAPTLLGFILFMMSGEVWRVLVFLPITVAASLVFWVRVGSMVRALAASGLS